MSGKTILDGTAATEENVKAAWFGVPNGKRFYCQLCGHKFKVGDYFRLVFAGSSIYGNFLVCKPCNLPNAIETHEKLQRTLREFPNDPQIIIARLLKEIAELKTHLTEH